MADTDALARQNPFLQVQDAIQRVRPVVRPLEQLADARERQAEAFERHDLVQPRDLVRAVGPPVGLRPKRLRAWTRKRRRLQLQQICHRRNSRYLNAATTPRAF